MSKHTVNPPVYINVNGREKKVAGTTITYEALVALAFDPVPIGEHIVVSVTYRGGPAENPWGSLVRDQSVHLANGMMFCAQVTSGA